MSNVTLADDRPKARIAHRCDDCGRTIEPGEIYRRWRGVGDDGPTTWKSCAHCGLVADWIWRTDADSIYYQDDGLDLSEYLHDGQIDPLRSMFAVRWRDVTPDDVRAAIAVLGPISDRNKR